jgi:hypothetical protein
VATSNEFVGGLVDVHRNLVTTWLNAGPEEVLKLLEDMDRMQIESMIMAYVGASAKHF